MKISYQFTEAELPQLITNEVNGLVTSFEYDNHNRLLNISTVNAADKSNTRQSRYTYLNDQHFIPATVQAPYNSSDTVMRYQYDKHGYLHKITNE
ncbi:hypothetical protein, partial [Fastidiosibacter lacustris]|uniref:hypothetical protein n=1 Tax=Fastidiosibacter lacustris TaxID=2056695 RepID=UPI0013003581